MSIKDLEYADWVVLCGVDQKKWKLDFNDAMKIEDPTSRIRLVDAKVAEENGQLTEIGIKCATDVLAKIEPFKRGVLFSKRPKSGLLGPSVNHSLTDFARTQWYTGNVQDKAKPLTLPQIPPFGRRLGWPQHTYSSCSK
ncbi:unnamed protein product [marine sediment metagenome]|uniref:Uncharacterized protein n=1 Tax=marine sediment metagenome TaxID=412755 RepID=X1DY76_9ZZZZ